MYKGILVVLSLLVLTLLPCVYFVIVKDFVHNIKSLTILSFKYDNKVNILLIKKPGFSLTFNKMSFFRKFNAIATPPAYGNRFYEMTPQQILAPSKLFFPFNFSLPHIARGLSTRVLRRIGHLSVMIVNNIGTLFAKDERGPVNVLRLLLFYVLLVHFYN